MSQDVFQKMKEIVIKNVESEVKEEELTRDTLLEGIGLNSLSFIKIVVDIEDNFEVTVEDEDLLFEDEKFTTFGGLVDYVTELMEQN